MHAARLPDDVVTAHRAVTDRARDEDGIIIPQSGVSWVPYTGTHPFHGQVMQLDASPVPLADDTDVEPGAIVGLGWFCARDITADDRVEFDDTTADAYRLPAIGIHHRYTERDLATIERAKKAITEAAAVVGVPHPLPGRAHRSGTSWRPTAVSYADEDRRRPGCVRCRQHPPTVVGHVTVHRSHRSYTAVTFR
ncbi:hypothetical protein [Streptomyces solaniscabiei]|uniref:hypothetical protein n=1 Tax=Streptomyces solaniscabiei TaxID=2683255 RepID=UPI001CE378EF|nr:hypothetical protein [Streptomyces solaniscabiei]